MLALYLLQTVLGFLAVSETLGAVVTVKSRQDEEDVLAEGNGNIDIDIKGQVWPSGGLTSGVQGLVIECIKCTIKGEFAVSAYQGDTLDFGDKEQLSKSFKDSDIIQSSGFDFTDAWVGVAIPKFEAHIEFSVKSDGSVPSGDDLVMRMLDNPIQIPVGRIPGLKLTIDPQVHAVLNAARALDFEHGWTLEVPGGSGILIPLMSPGDTISPGLKQTVTKMTAFKSKTDDLAFSYEFSMRPSLGISVSFAGIGATIASYVDLPKVSVGIQQVYNVTGNCAAATAGSKDAIYDKLTKITPKLGYEVGMTFNNDEIIGADVGTPTVMDVPDTCMRYDKKHKVLVAPNGVAGAFMRVPRLAIVLLSLVMASVFVL